MNILLMGCSWAVPNYNEQVGDPPETHLEFLLKKSGHDVINCAMNGGSNLDSLNRAIEFLIDKKPIVHPSGDMSRFPDEISCEEDINIDKVIWFYTDPGRDVKVIRTQGKSIYQQIEEISRYTYKSYASFLNNLKCHVSIIGGCADVHPCITDYINPNFLMYSWQKELIGISTKFWGLKSGLSTPSDEDILLLDEVLAVLNRMHRSRHIFPDGGHPGKWAHQELFIKLSKKY